MEESPKGGRQDAGQFVVRAGSPVDKPRNPPADLPDISPEGVASGWPFSWLLLFGHAKRSDPAAGRPSEARGRRASWRKQLTQKPGTKSLDSSFRGNDELWRQRRKAVAHRVRSYRERSRLFALAFDLPSPMTRRAGGGKPEGWPVGRPVDKPRSPPANLPGDSPEGVASGWPFSWLLLFGHAKRSDPLPGRAAEARGRRASWRKQLTQKPGAKSLDSSFRWNDELWRQRRKAIAHRVRSYRSKDVPQPFGKINIASP